MLDQIPKLVPPTYKPVFFRFGIFGVPFLPDREFMQMAVRPAHDDLNDIVKPVQTKPNGVRSELL